MFQIPDFDIDLTISFANPTREEFLRERFEGELKKASEATIQNVVKAGLKVIGSDEVVIFSVPNSQANFIQFLHVNDRYTFDYMVTVRTWENRSAYWRCRRGLEELGYKPASSLLHPIKLFNYSSVPRYSWVETSTIRNVSLTLAQDYQSLSLIGSHCLKTMYQIDNTQALSLTFLSNKKFWL